MQTKTLGIVLVVVGILMIAYTGFNYVTTENVVDIGPIDIDREKNNSVQWSPIVGGAILVGGILLLIMGNKSSK